MPEDLKSYKIFIASPAGLQPERKAFHAETSSYSESEAMPRGVLFRPTGWEETIGGVGRPQSFINEDVRECDYFLLLLWDRWGSPTSTDDSGYSSGTEEELSVALECLADPNMPMRQIVMMFKGVDPKQLSDSGPQLQKVLDFKSQIELEKKHLFHTFDTLDDFCTLLRRHLGQWLRNHEEGTMELPKRPLPEPPSSPHGTDLGIPVEEATGAARNPEVAHAWSLANEGRLSEAEVAFSKAIVRGDDPDAFLGYFAFLQRAGRPDQALVMLDRARAIFEERKDEVGIARTYGNLGIVLKTRGDLDGAEEMYRKALDIDEKLGRLEGMANAYGNLGVVLTTRGDLDGAEEMYRKALDIDEKLGRLEGMANAYGNLGIVLSTRDDLDGAEEMHKKSLAIDEKLGRLEGMANAYGNLGNVLAQRSDLDRAEEMYRKALDINEKLGHLEGMANAYGSLGIVLSNRGDLDGAEEMYRKALDIAEKLGHLEGMANAYGNLGNVLSNRGDLDGAEEMHKKSLEIEEKLGHLEGMASDYENLGNVLVKRGDLDGAEEMYRKAMELWEKLGAPQQIERVKLRLDSLDGQKT